MIFRTAATILHNMAKLGEPSSRRKNIPELSRAVKAENGTNQRLYSTAKGSSRSEPPNRCTTCGANRQNRVEVHISNKEDTTMDCVMLIRATLGLLCDKWMEATTDAPTPNIRPMPVENNHSGATMLTAARASLPIPFPTKIPSVMTNNAENIIPSTVGSSNLRNNAAMSMFLKSMLSLIFSIIFSLLYIIVICFFV